MVREVCCAVAGGDVDVTSVDGVVVVPCPCPLPAEALSDAGLARLAFVLLFGGTVVKDVDVNCPAMTVSSEVILTIFRVGVVTITFVVLATRFALELVVVVRAASRLSRYFELLLVELLVLEDIFEEGAEETDSDTAP